MNLLNINQAPADFKHPIVVPTQGNLNSKHVILFATPERGDFAGDLLPWPPCFNAVLAQFNQIQSDHKERTIAIPCMDAEFYNGNKDEFDAEVAGNAMMAAFDFVEKNPGTKIHFMGEGNRKIALIYQSIHEGFGATNKFKDRIVIDADGLIGTADTSVIALPRRANKVFGATQTALALAANNAVAIAAAKAKAEKDKAEAQARAEKDKAEQARQEQEKTQRAETSARSFIALALTQGNTGLQNAHQNRKMALAEMNALEGHVKKGDVIWVTKIAAVVNQAAEDAMTGAKKALQGAEDALAGLGEVTNPAIVWEKERVYSMASEALKIASEAQRIAELANAAIPKAEQVKAENDKADQARQAEEQALTGIKAAFIKGGACLQRAQVAAQAAHRAFLEAETAVKEGSVGNAQIAKDKATNAENDARKAAWDAVSVLNEASKALGNHTKDHLIKEKQKVNDIANEALRVAKEASKSENKAGGALQRAIQERAAEQRRWRELSDKLAAGKGSAVPRWEGVHTLWQRQIDYLYSTLEGRKYVRNVEQRCATMKATVIDRNLVAPVHYIDKSNRVKQAPELENAYSSALDDIDQDIEARLARTPHRDPPAAAPAEEDSIVIVEIDNKVDK